MINSKQRAFLRAMANKLDSTFQIGKSGISQQVLNQYDELLVVREIVKSSILKSCDEAPRAIADSIAASIGAEVVSVIGRKFVLYRKSEKLAKDGKSIILPW
jgi:RNA-binding protein